MSKRKDIVKLQRALELETEYRRKLRDDHQSMITALAETNQHRYEELKHRGTGVLVNAHILGQDLKFLRWMQVGANVKSITLENVYDARTYSPYVRFRWKTTYVRTGEFTLPDGTSYVTFHPEAE